jgi:hypothetical protein
VLEQVRDPLARERLVVDDQHPKLAVDVLLTHDRLLRS